MGVWGERRRIHFQCDALCGKRGKPSHSSEGIPPVVIVVLVPRVKVRHAMWHRMKCFLIVLEHYIVEILSDPNFAFSPNS